ncbi:MAG TPA: PKD domain-containing protein [Solirubrobacteraceae bacterium]|nr:PKD domain-containing protein [Solirubrobacteraceae bacterium]
MRISLFTAATLACALAVAALSTTAPAATNLSTSTATTVASGGPLTVNLHVSSHNALQFHGVAFQAEPSSSDIVVYGFAYGDGAVDYSYQPDAMHGYRKPGTYHALVGVIDSSGDAAVSASVSIHVTDGVPPVVRIDHPRPGQRLRLGSAGVRFTGSASDTDGVSKVQLAIQLISSAQRFKTGGACVWYDGKTWLVLDACSSPHFFTVPYSHGHWSYRMGSKVRIPAGSYVIRVRAIDRAGNISHYYAVPLRTILPFELAR